MIKIHLDKLVFMNFKHKIKSKIKIKRASKINSTNYFHLMSETLLYNFKCFPDFLANVYLLDSFSS